MMTLFISKVVAAACLRINQDSETGHMGKRTLYAGQPIHANLSIHTLFHWGGEKLPEYSMRFDIEELVKDWLISGHKRGNFVAKARPNSEYDPVLTMATGRRDIQRTNNNDSSTPWRAFSTQSRSDCASNLKHDNYGISLRSQYRYIPSSRCREDPCPSTRREEYFCCWNGTLLNSCSLIFARQELIKCGNKNIVT